MKTWSIHWRVRKLSTPLVSGDIGATMKGHGGVETWCGERRSSSRIVGVCRADIDRVSDLASLSPAVITKVIARSFLV